MLFFIDESGTDHKEAPYEVLAAISIKENTLWNIIQAIQEAEFKHFGTSFRVAGLELKGKKLLKKKVFRQASQLDAIDSSERIIHVKNFLDKSRNKKGAESAGLDKKEFTAYAQAKIAFVDSILDICASYGIKIFASIVDPSSPIPDGNMLRKDYTFLFERIFYYLEDLQDHGIIVFDELEKAKSTLLLSQMRHYFLETYKGRTRSSKIIPEPFFVHSDLTTAIQIVDIIAYCVNWGFRIEDKMDKITRKEIEPFADKIFELSYKGKHIDELDGQQYNTYGITFIENLVPSRKK